MNKSRTAVTISAPHIPRDFISMQQKWSTVPFAHYFTGGSALRYSVARWKGLRNEKISCRASGGCCPHPVFEPIRILGAVWPSALRSRGLCNDDSRQAHRDHLRREHLLRSLLRRLPGGREPSG